ncbi:hypothetical protein AURDEDRAFT_166370 [Auricularia subglabra TFB-10046 SS5]|uniref:Uncharacterized protein n=1 Tax=Auricularia subglabra (strain TFB-10046 / SS5) TaxID=717982 RepID=J0WXR4_AURST|nr:hypothetical protein AURDEDRAFT_166370 [Auricularia subglabra TFB-10046 SS5]
MSHLLMHVPHSLQAPIIFPLEPGLAPSSTRSQFLDWEVPPTDFTFFVPPPNLFSAPIRAPILGFHVAYPSLASPGLSSMAALPGSSTVRAQSPASAPSSSVSSAARVGLASSAPTSPQSSASPLPIPPASRSAPLPANAPRPRGLSSHGMTHAEATARCKGLRRTQITSADGSVYSLFVCPMAGCSAAYGSIQSVKRHMYETRGVCPYCKGTYSRGTKDYLIRHIGKDGTRGCKAYWDAKTRLNDSAER